MLRRRRRPDPVVWFLDIDGVLAPFARRQDDLTPVHVGGHYGTLLVSPSVIARIRDLHRAGTVRVHWLTAWEDDANTEFAPRVGLDTYPVHHEPDTGPDTSRYWKEAIVRHHAATTGAPFVWADDEMTYYDSHQTVPADYDDTALVIAPVSSVGLTHDHLDAIESFASSWTPKPRQRR